jgi:hypothetical protein
MSNYSGNPISEGAPPLGLYELPNGLTLTQAVVTGAFNAGFSGIYIDPRYVTTAVGPILLPTQSFKIKSEMYYGFGFGYGSSPATPSAYVNFTNTTGDGFQMYGAGTDITGVAQALEGLNIVGTTTGNSTTAAALVHLAGGTRHTNIEKCFVLNNSSNQYGYGLIDDTAYGPNGEDNLVQNSAIFGAYAGIGIGISNASAGGSGLPNDTQFTQVQTGGGTYGVNFVAGGNYVWTNWYDRSSPTVAAWNQGASAGAADLFGCEAHQTTAGAYNYQVAGGTLRVYAKADTVGASSGNFLNLTGGSFYGVTGQAPPAALAISGGTFNAGPFYDFHQATITGTAGTINYWQFTPYTLPSFSGFSGTLNNLGGYPQVVAYLEAGGATTTQTLTYTPPAVKGTYRAVYNVRATTVGTSITQNLSFTNEGGGSTSGAPPIWKLGSVTPVIAVVGTGSYSGAYDFPTDNSGSVITLTLTVAGTDTFGFSLELIRIA